MKKYIGVIRVACLVIPFFVFGQKQDDKKDIYVLFDNVVGLDNTSIYNGNEYREEFRTLDNNYPYFDSPDFITGTIEYNGELYFNISIKYNLYNQEVIAKLKSKNASETVIKLYNSRIGSFVINNRKFLNISPSNNGISGFFEEVFIDTQHKLLIKHKKFKKDLYRNEQMYVEYVTAKKEFLILKNDTYNILDSKKDITNVFPDSKQKINQFYRDYRSLRKADYSQFLIKLLQELKLARLK